MNTEGTRGRDGTEDRRLCIEDWPGGAGNNNWIFSSNVILFVSFGSKRCNLFALVGGGGSGGSCVGLPGFDIKIDFRGVIEDPDLLRLCFGEGSLGNNARSFSGSLLYGRGRCMMEFAEWRVVVEFVEEKDDFSSILGRLAYIPGAPLIIVFTIPGLS